MKLFTLDIAARSGWAFYDTDNHVSSIEHGSLHFKGSNAFERVVSMREQLPPIMRRYEWDIGYVEAPLPFIPTYQSEKHDLAGTAKKKVPSAKSSLGLNYLAGAAQMLILGMNKRCVSVAPRTWQTVIPASIQGKDSKDRVKQFCEVLGITGGSKDSRDAAVIALWAAGHSQELKLMERVRAA